MPVANERLEVALNELDRVEAEIDAFEERVSQLKARKNELETVTLIDIYNDLGLREATSETLGRKAKRDLYVTGSLNKDPVEREKAIAWIASIGMEDVINVNIQASWAKGDRAKAQAFYDHLRRQDNSAKVEIGEGVHFKTLGKIALDRIRQGLEVPLTTLGLDVTSRVKFTKKRTTSTP